MLTEGLLPSAGLWFQIKRARDVRDPAEKT